MKIVYTPLHGTGVILVPASLRKFGFRNIITVKEQNIPDGNFRQSFRRIRKNAPQ